MNGCSSLARIPRLSVPINSYPAAVQKQDVKPLWVSAAGSKCM